MTSPVKNQVYTAEILGYSSEGLGIARIGGQVVFVHDAIAGEVCDILVMKVLFSAYLFDGEWDHCARYLIPVLSFLLGIFAAECIHRHFKYMEKVHWRQLIILAEIVLLFVVGFLPQRVNTLANVLVSFVCAMQVQTFRKVRGHAYASTMCIGNMRSGTEALCAYFHTHEPEALRNALTYFGVIGLFVVGAGLGARLTGASAVRGIWVSCALLTVSFLVMFIHEERRA